MNLSDRRTVEFKEALVGQALPVQGEADVTPL
jgi:hypothetical protein